MDRATPRVPGQAGPDLLPRPGVPVRAQRDHRGEGDRLAGPRASSASTSPAPRAATFRVADYRRLFRRARQFGLGLTVHTGEAGPGRGGRPGRRAARAGPDRPRRQGGLRPAGDGDDPRARHRPRDLPDLEPQHPGRLGLGRVPLDLRHVPAQRGPVHDQHRRPGDAQDLHPRRDGASSAGSGSCRVEDQELRRRATSLAASFVPERAPTCPGRRVLEPAPPRRRRARRGLVGEVTCCHSPSARRVEHDRRPLRGRRCHRDPGTGQVSRMGSGSSCSVQRRHRAMATTVNRVIGARVQPPPRRGRNGSAVVRRQRPA